MSVFLVLRHGKHEAHHSTMNTTSTRPFASLFSSQPPSPATPTRQGGGQFAERLYKRLFAAPDQFTQLGWILLGMLVFLLLLPLLSYPLGPDNGLFFVAGQKIVHQGGVHYRDIVDVKPPLIYYVNGLAILLFGDHQISIRILDLLVQLATCFFLVRLVRRATGSDSWAALGAVLYPIMYISPNFANTSQVESFAGLLLFPAIYLFLFRRTGWGFLSIGLLCGVLTFFKFTFGIALAAFLLGDLLLYNDSWKTRLRNYTMMAAGYGVVLGLFLLYLVLLDAMHGFLNMQTFLTGYTGLQWSSKAGLLRDALQKIPSNMADEYSLTMLFGTVVGIAAAVAGVVRQSAGNGLPLDEGNGALAEHRPGSTDYGLGNGIGPATSTTENNTTRLLRICTILFLLLLGTIALEAKWLHYHFLRLFPLGAVLGGYGLLRIAQIFSGKSVGRFRWVALPVAAALLLGFSPLTRYAFHLRPALLMLTRGADAFDNYYAYSRTSAEWTMEDLHKIGEFVKKERREGEKIFVSSGVGGMVYLACDYVPDVSIFHSCFLIARFAPQEWRDSVRAYLLRERPRFVIVHQSDRMFNITGTEETSAETITHLMPEVETMLEREYKVAMETPAFKVYEKKNVAAE